MRTIKLIALTIISFLSIGIYAQKKVEVTLKERQPQERESLIYKNNEITSKIVYEYDCNGYKHLQSVQGRCNQQACGNQRGYQS